MLHCHCCHAEITAPKWNDGKPYGYSCFAKLFGSAKSVRYIPVEGKVQVIRNWDDHTATMNPAQASEFAGKSSILFTHSKVSRLWGASDHGVKYDGIWYIPESAEKVLFRLAKKKGCLHE